MTKSLFGLFTALLCAVCVIVMMQCIRKKRYGLATLFFLNALTNLVNSIHAVYGMLF